MLLRPDERLGAGSRGAEDVRNHAMYRTGQCKCFGARNSLTVDLYYGALWSHQAQGFVRCIPDLRTLKFDWASFQEQKMPTPFQKPWSSSAEH